MRTALRVGAATAFLLACNDGVLDIGSDDGGGSDPIAPNMEPTQYDTTAVANAGAVCDLVRSDAGVGTKIRQAIDMFTPYPTADLRSMLAGGWRYCAAGDAQDARSFQFTTDGHWYTLVDDGSGGLRRSPPGTVPAPDAGDAAIAEEEGTFTFLDSNQQPVASNGMVLFVANNGTHWFHPEFIPIDAAPPTQPVSGRFLLMNLDNLLSQELCTFVGP